MELLRSLMLLVIIIVLLLTSHTDSVAEVLFNKAFPRLEEQNFTKSFYLGSKFSLLWLNSSTQNSTDSIFHSSVLDQSFTVTGSDVNSSENLCAAHLRYIIETIWSNQKDASILSFLDSFAKLVPGIKDGNLDWQGNQKQCESTKIFPGSGSTLAFGGKYCKAEWKTTFNSSRSLSHYTGVCVPSSCSRNDFQHLKPFLEKFFFLKISEESRAVEISCIGEAKLRIDSIIFNLVFYGLIFLGIMSTVYERYFERADKKSKESSRPSVFSIFSIPENWKSLSGKRVSKNDILIIHYIRSFAALLVALFHSVAILSSYLVRDPGSQMLAAQESFIFLVIPRTFMAIFFFLTGFLIHSDSNPFKSIFKAFIRLSPSYYLTVFAHTSYINTVGIGSKIDFGGVLYGRDDCSKVFWKNLLYIQNFSPTSESCNISLWSLAVTFQLYIIGVFVVWLISRIPSIGITSAILLMTHGLVMSFKYFYDIKIADYIGIPNKPINFSSVEEYGRYIVAFMDEFNILTSTWLCPFALGIIFAYFLPKIQQASHQSQKKCVIGNLILIITFFATFFLVIYLEQSNITCSLVQAIAPLTTGLLLSMVIFIFHPRSEFINYKLTSKTSPLLVHFSRISYTLYLTHYAVLVAISNSTALTPILDTFSTLCIIGGCFLVMYSVSVFLYIFVERPIQNLRKIMNV